VALRTPGLSGALLPAVKDLNSLEQALGLGYRQILLERGSLLAMVGALAGALYMAARKTVLGLGRVIAAGPLAFGVGLIPFGSLALALPVKLASLAAFVGFTWLSGTMGKSEFKELRRFAGGMIAVPFARAG